MRIRISLFLTLTILTALTIAGCNPGGPREAFNLVPKGEYYRMHMFSPVVVFNSDLFKDYTGRFESLVEARNRVEEQARNLGISLDQFKNFVRFEPLEAGKRCEYFHAGLNAGEFEKYFKEEFGAGSLTVMKAGETEYRISGDGSGFVILDFGILACSGEAMEGVMSVLDGSRDSIWYDDKFNKAYNLINYEKYHEFFVQWDNLDPLLEAVKGKATGVVKANTLPKVENISNIDAVAYSVSWTPQLKIGLVAHFKSADSADAVKEVIDENKEALVKKFLPELLRFVLKWVDVKEKSIGNFIDQVDIYRQDRNGPAIVVYLGAEWGQIFGHLESKKIQ